MQFDKTQALALMKMGMSSADKRRTADHTLAMGAALDDLATRLQSDSYVTSYTVSATANDRDLQLRGNNNDLHSIFAIKMGEDAEQRVLDYVPKKRFLKDYDDPSTTAAAPAKYTQISSEEGYPIIRFDCPPETAEELTVYYWSQMNADNISAARSITAVVLGTKAWFYGVETDRGIVLYEQFKAAVRVARESDDFHGKPTSEFQLSRQDQLIRRQIQSDIMSRN